MAPVSRTSPSVSHRPRVLVYGSFKPAGDPCGISSAVRGLAESSIGERFDLELISTYRPPRRRDLVTRVLHGISLGLRTARQIWSGRASLVDVHTASGQDFLKHGAIVLAARLVGRPCILRIHGGEFIEQMERRRGLRKKLTGWLLRQSDCVVALSEGWRRALVAVDSRLRVVVIPNSMDGARFGRIMARLDPDRRGLLLLGNLCAAKGHFDLLEAVARLNDERIEVLLAGAERVPGTKEKLRELARDLGIEAQVEFLGPIFDSELDATMARTLIMVLPSHAENMPVSVMEAMAAGLPIVATRVGAIPEMIDDQATGRLVSPRSPDELAEALRQLLASPSERESLAAAASQYATSNWDRAVVAERTAHVYAEVLKRSDAHG